MRQAADDDVMQFEGLVLTTARMNGTRFAVLGYDEDDVAQILRMKVLQAMRRYDPSRSKQTLKGYVFSCVVNRVKDLRRDAATAAKDASGGRVTQAYIEDLAPRERFEAEQVSVEHAFDVVDEHFDLPSSLNERERRVTILLALEFQRKEIAEILAISVSTVHATHKSVQAKMADWRPDSRPGERAVVAIGELQLVA